MDLPLLGISGRDMNYRAIIVELERAAAEVSPLEAPVLLGELERVRAMIWTRMMNPSPNHEGHQVIECEPDRLLTPQQAASLLGVGIRWLYRNSRRLPFTRRLSRKSLRFSEKGLRRWLAAKKS